MATAGTKSDDDGKGGSGRRGQGLREKTRARTAGEGECRGREGRQLKAQRGGW